MTIKRLLPYPWAAIVMTCAACGPGTSSNDGYVTLGGDTMGTYFSVRYAATEQCQLQQQQVAQVLARINASMSTYDANSELSRFNTQQDLQWSAVSTDLVVVLSAAAEVWRLSAGAFDVTIGPLVNLWGFGAAQADQRVHAEAQALAASQVGMAHLQMDFARENYAAAEVAKAAKVAEVKRPRIRKNVPGLYVDLSALAKGFAVDEVAKLLHEQQCDNYMVDIGGEIKLAGHNPQQQPWRIGIEAPDAAKLGTVQRILTLSDISVATSGDYRNFRMVAGQRVDHVFDPRTGQPADNLVVSATVLHSSAMWADAWATTMMVVGADAGLALADKLLLPVYILERLPAAAGTDPGTDELRLRERYNSLMAEYL